MKRLGALAFLSIAAAAPAPVDAVEWTPYGFVRFDAIYDDSRMSNHQFPMYALSEDELAGPANDSRTTLHPRLTRFGAKLGAFDLPAPWSARALIEIDFQNGGRESREVIRMRQGYFEVRRGDLAILAGQTWDLISPLYPAANNDGMMWNAGNLGDRRPQARVSWTPSVGQGAIALAVAATQTGAVDSKDLDGNGTLDGSDAAEPGVQGRAGYARAFDSGASLKAGAWGHFAREETASPVGEEREFESWVGGFDVSLFPHAKFGVEGEGWSGENLSDIRGGIGQGINRFTGRAVASKGGWAQVVLKPHAKVAVFAGYAIDDPDDEDVPTLEEATSKSGANSAIQALGDTGRTKNEAAFGVVRVRPWAPLQIALEYIHWKTAYAGLDEGTDNRIDAHTTLYF